jgi:DNA-binding GntR family transcriptional regulator
MTDDVVRPLKTKRLSLSARAQQCLLGIIESGAYHPGEQLPSQAELSARQGIRFEVSSLAVSEEPADARLADKLQLGIGTPLTSVRRVIVADSQPVALMRDVMPASVLPSERIDEALSGSVLDSLRRKADLRFSQAIVGNVAFERRCRPILASGGRRREGTAADRRNPV